MTNKDIMKNKIIAEVGIFPTLIERYRSDFPPGKIFLKQGEHKGANKGFGVTHILAEHEADLSKHNLSLDADGVIAYIKLILQSGAGIYSEYDNLRGFPRPMIIQSRIGVVVLERKEVDRITAYSVITAFGGRSAKGEKIGMMPR